MTLLAITEGLAAGSYSGSVDAALSVLDRIEADIGRLKEFPACGSLPRLASLRRRGYRILLSMRWIVFYKADAKNNTVMLYAITDQSRDYKDLL